jgi:hypothetical protein
VKTLPDPPLATAALKRPPRDFYAMRRALARPGNLRAWRLAPLVLLGLTACIPVMSAFYEPQTTGDVRKQGPCSMNIVRTLFLHLESNVDVRITAISKAPGHERALVSIGITVPAGVAVKLVEPVVTLQEGTSQPPTSVGVGRLRKPRSVVDGRIEDYMDPGKTMTGTAGYGIEVELPHSNPPELLVTVPPLSINGHRVNVEPIRFILKTRPHVTGLCQ